MRALPYALEEQPQTNGELEQEDRTAEVPDGDHLRELGENDESESTNADPDRGEQSPHGQWFGDVSRPEPQVAEHRRTEAKEKQTDVIRGAVRSDAHARQRRQFIGAYGREIARSAEKTQHVKIVEYGYDQNRSFSEAEERRQQSQSPIHPLEDDIKCSDQQHIGRKHQQIAGDAESK